MTNLIIDTDPGQDIDDLLALWFALKRPEFAVRAITTVTYPSAARARLARRLTHLLGMDGVPVGAGMQSPMRAITKSEMDSQRDLARSMNHGLGGDDGGEIFPDAASLIIETVRRCAGDIFIACLGPQTNIAAALLREPDIAPLISGIAAMGGEFARNLAEHNVAWDPVAADIVLRSGAALAFGPWSVTREFTLTLAECEVFRSSAAPAAHEIHRAVKAWAPAQSWKPGPVVYDIFPLMHCLSPGKFYAMGEMPVSIETGGGAARGMTVRDHAGGVRAQVAEGADAGMIREEFFKTVLQV